MPSDRDRIIEALRGIAPGHPVTRVWGRLEGATPEHAQEGNAWAADVEDLADLVLRAIGGCPMVHLGPLSHLEIDGQDVTHCIQIPEPWAVEHRLNVLIQNEARLGQPNQAGERWVERRVTGKVIAVCSCGYTSGLVDSGDVPSIEELAAQHPRTS